MPRQVPSDLQIYREINEFFGDKAELIDPYVLMQLSPEALMSIQKQCMWAMHRQIVAGFEVSVELPKMTNGSAISQ